MSTATELRRNSDLDSALTEARALYVAGRPKSAALHDKASEVMPGGNTRSVLAYSPFPTAMARGEDCRLWDIDGHEYLDLCGEYTAGLFGHSEPLIHDVLHATLKRGTNLAAVGEGEEKLARILCGRFPSIERVRFANSGTEANLMALTAARAKTGRNAIMAVQGGYHGGVLTFPLAGRSMATLPLDVVLCRYNDLPDAERVVASRAGDLAAIIVEPMLGSGGCIPATRDFLQGLRKLADDHGAVLIFDEVMTSRMSGGGMQARLGITSDMTTLGKYIGGGMSFGAFGGKADIMDLFASRVPHAGTFNNNVLSMAAGSTAMARIFTPERAEMLFQSGEALRQRLNGLAEQAGVPMGFTGIGSMMTVQFRRPLPTAPVPATPAEEMLRELFFFDMLAAGIYLARRGMVALSLPVGAAELDRFTTAVGEFIETRGALLKASAVIH
jgi:glutamate-1-semialdehyde 2,1-aminomutase